LAINKKGNWLKIIANKQLHRCKFAIMKGKRYLVGLFLVLLFPIVCFLIVWNKGGNGHVKLPRCYGKIDSIKSGTYKGKTALDTFWNTVPNIALTNQLGKTVNLFDDVKNKIVVVDFFFTTCKTTCPRLNSNLKFLQTKYKKADSLLAFASISVDSDNDSVPALRAYANSFSANHDKWWFCRGNTQQIKRYMYNDIHLPDMKASDTTNEAFTHSDKWVLLDKDRNIRGYYDALDTMEIRRCADDISLLILEKKRKHFSNDIAK
jgi:protein SCO1